MDNLHAEMLNSIESFRKALEEKYLFLPTEPEENLIAFETKFNVRIPEDYRFFLLNISNGIVKKNKWGLNLIEKIDFVDFFYEDNEYNPSIPFELANKVVFGSSSNYKEVYPYHYEITFDENYDIFEKGYSNGQINIAGYGCGTSAFIVVKGNEYGTIWINNFSSNNEVYPESDFKKKKSRFSFTDWLLEVVNREAAICNEIIEERKRAELIEEFDKKKREGFAEKNRKLEIERLDQIKREKFNEQKKEIEREEQRIKKTHRNLFTYLIDKFFC